MEWERAGCELSRWIENYRDVAGDCGENRNAHAIIATGGSGPKRFILKSQRHVFSNNERIK